MINPYQVLGVSRDASDDEIKKAYRNLSRRYHPDANINNPNKAQAEEKFKEVQMAYDQIMKEKQSGYSYDSFGGGSYKRYNGSSYGGFENSYSYQDDTDSVELRAAANYINNYCYREALNVLSGIANRTAKWYYYSALANSGAGNNVTARQHISQACAMDPNNLMYKNLEARLQYGGEWYTNMGRNYARPLAGGGTFCISMILLNLFCNMCCLPFGSIRFF
ncbi:MAG: DnaJ domain-containing protein [Lachnospiraceae bacterium]|nr:DnaJ domain-containing protein [Lachnospiraceae bacterium]